MCFHIFLYSQTISFQQTKLEDQRKQQFQLILQFKLHPMGSSWYIKAYTYFHFLINPAKGKPNIAETAHKLQKQCRDFKNKSAKGSKWLQALEDQFPWYYPLIPELCFDHLLWSSSKAFWSYLEEVPILQGPHPHHYCFQNHQEELLNIKNKSFFISY